MPKQGPRNSAYPIVLKAQEVASRLFLVAVIAVVGLFGYFAYVVFSGAGATDNPQAVQTAATLTGLLTAAAILALVCSLLLFYDDDKLGAIYVVVGLVFLYGVPLVSSTILGESKLITGVVGERMLYELQIVAWLCLIPGVVHFLVFMGVKTWEARDHRATVQMRYGTDVKKEQRKRPLVPALAPCWQLPYCREGIRARCPIFKAGTRCWKQRVGCMCEENVIVLAMGDGEGYTSADAARDKGFVPIGDLLEKSEHVDRSAQVRTRPGPRGVRIPENPNLSAAQKRERCRNCVIYTEHQRLKHQMLAPVAALAMPILAGVFWGPLCDWMGNILLWLNGWASHFAVTQVDVAASNQGLVKMMHEMPLQAVMVICGTLLAMTAALRLLEFCVFTIKI